jgi:shikimate dehydrogenase
VYAVIGHPVRHSRSPTLHNAWFAALGIDGVYVALEVDPAAAGELGRAIRTLGLAGANLTVPFKTAILDDLDAVGPVASVLGAVNTVVRRGDRLEGYNTDADGYVDGLVGEFGDVVAGARVLVLGAGGAGRAVGLGLARRGAASVCWLNRTVSRAEAVAARCAVDGVALSAAALSAEAFAALAPHTDLVVTCTSGPAAERIAGFDLSLLPPHAIWSDINYWMDDPPGYTGWKARGGRVQGGMPMLVHQAARAFQHFTGTLPDTDPNARAFV